MAATDIPSVHLVLKASALEDLARIVNSPPINPSTSLPTPPKSQTQNQSLQARLPKLLSFRNPSFEAARLLGQSKYSALAFPVQRSAPTVFTPEFLRAAMSGYGQRLVGQMGHHQRLPSLHLEDTMDVGRMEDTEMTTSPDTPRRGSTSNFGLLSPFSGEESDSSQQLRIPPFLRNNTSASIDKPAVSPSTFTPDRRDSPMSISTTSTAGSPGPMRSPGVSQPATDQEMLYAPDYMMPLLDPYFPNRPMVSQNEVGNATSALFQHMKHRFNPTLEASRGIKNIVEGRTLPRPMSDVSHQNGLLYRGRRESRPVPSQLQTPDHMIAPQQTQSRSLAGMLEQREVNGTAKFQVRQLDGISFHRVLQIPFTNELRAHYAAEDKSHQAGRTMSMYKAQLSFPNRDPRSTYGHIGSELWYFFEIKTPQTPTSAESCAILAIPASDLEEKKAEECPMFRGGVQINARRRGYSVKPFGRFRLECLNMGAETQTLESGIRHDLEDGSCRLFTWTEV